MGSALVDAAKSLLGVSDALPGVGGAPPSWKDRIKEAAYTSPSGSRIVFDFEDVSTEVALRNAKFDFPSVDGAYIQSNGSSARSLPMRVMFWGNSHDLLANIFETALLEPGVGRLEHPLYGSHDVVPFGSVSRRDDLKSAANQTVIEVSFFKTITDLYPVAGSSPKSDLVDALELQAALAGNHFDDSVNLATAASRGNAIATVRAAIGKASDKLSAVAAVSNGALKDFRDAQSALNFGMDVLIGQPLQLAQQVTNLLTAPARALAGIADRLAAYSAFAEDIFASKMGAAIESSVTLQSRKLQASNDFHVADLFLSNAIAGSATAVLNHTFSTKPEAIGAAEDIIEQLDALIAWREARYSELDQVDVGESIQALQNVVYIVAGYLVEISFTLVPERRIVLDRERTIIDLSAELYGAVDERLDFLIESNALTGSEILELPRGRSIVYYPS